ncbi:MAG: hypothetical protein M1815_004313 [Lichina confinis]|nr:MAG: hypothetical protein M1815_004313 [Lichina confinis]
MDKMRSGCEDVTGTPQVSARARQQCRKRNAELYRTVVLRLAIQATERPRPRQRESDDVVDQRIPGYIEGYVRRFWQVGQDAKL